MAFLKFLLTFAIIIIASIDIILCEENVEKSSNSVSTALSAAPAEKSALAPSNSGFSLFSTDLSSWKNGYTNSLVTYGAVVLCTLVLGALALFYGPAITYKLAQAIGNHDSVVTYSANGADAPSHQANANYNDAYGAYMPAAYSNYQKRSLEYVGPVLKTLLAAYEKYGHPTKIDKKN